MKPQTITVERSEDLVIQLPEDCGFEPGEKVNLRCTDENSIIVEHLVKVDVDLEDDLVLKLALEAHRRDITLNDLICEILTKFLDA